MIGFIKKDMKKIVIALSSALIITLIFVLLKMNKFILVECSVSYLNPWQYFFRCNLIYWSYYLIVFAISFFIIFYLMKKFRFPKKLN